MSKLLKWADDGKDSRAATGFNSTYEILHVSGTWTVFLNFAGLFARKSLEEAKQATQEDFDERLDDSSRSVELTAEELEAQHQHWPGFIVQCEKCKSYRTVSENDMGWSEASGNWGSLDIVCLACDNRINLTNKD